MSSSDSDVEQHLTAEKKEELDETGLPVNRPYGDRNPVIIYSIITLVQLGLGYLAAFGIYALMKHVFGSSDADTKIAKLKEGDLGYLYIAARVMALVLSVQQIFVAVGRKSSKCANPDQYVYETKLGPPPYVGLVSQGVIGQFNRAQRAIDNTRETYPVMVMDTLLAGYVFPKPILVLACLYLFARCGFSYTYMYSSRGKAQAVSFILMMVLGGLELFAGVQALI